MNVGGRILFCLILVAGLPLGLKASCPQVVSSIDTFDFDPQKEAWASYLGGLWADVLQPHLFKGDDLLEVAPGDQAKIGRGLLKREFRGRLYIVEPQGKACKKVCLQYRDLLPRAIIQGIKAPLHRVVLRDSIDGLIANHPLDDMIAGTFLDDENFQDFFNDHYDSPIDRTRAIWQGLKTKDLLEDAKASVVSEWINALQELQPRFVVISQYESFFFRSHNFELADVAALEVLRRIEEQALSIGYRKDPINHPRIRNAERWLRLTKIIND